MGIIEQYQDLNTLHIKSFRDKRRKKFQKRIWHNGQVFPKLKCQHSDIRTLQIFNPIKFN